MEFSSVPSDFQGELDISFSWHALETWAIEGRGQRTSWLRTAALRGFGGDFTELSHKTRYIIDETNLLTV